MDLPITSLTAALLAFLFVGLALRVINLRRTGVGPSVGMNEDERFLRAVRSHANLAEYAPLFLILLALYELQGGIQFVTLGTAILFVLGRIFHAIGFGFLGTGPWRTLGMVGTNAALLVLAGALVWSIAP